MADFDVVDLVEGSGDSDVKSCLCLIGKVVLGKNLKAPVLANILTSAWRTRAPFKVEDWNNNLFLFRFENEEDKANVLNDGPWSVMGSLLILISLENGMVIPEIGFSICPFWVQIHGLPVEKMSRTNADIIGRRFGKLLAVEASSENILLSRSFLRVRVEINISKPLPKGFWLRGKDDPGRDRWISFKYEKLPDFCYACGRIGHDNRGCKFVSKEDGDKSGYGPELRTGRARRVDVPIEVIHEEGGGTSARDENLTLKQSEHLVDRAARGSEVGMERVVFFATGQNQLRDAGVREAHSTTGTNQGYSQRTAVVLARPTGNPLPIIPLSSPQGISVLDSSRSSESLAVYGSDPSTEINLATINTKPPSPTQNSSHNYFVTEPSDSPRALIPTQAFTYHNINPPIPLLEAQSPHSSPIAENPTPCHPSPSKPESPKSLEVSLSQVFNSLNLKRKAPEESLEPSRSKILRLCSPYPNPKSPNPKPSRPARKQSKGNRRVIGPSRGSSSVGGTGFLEDGLCDVPVHHSLMAYDMDSGRAHGYTTTMVDVDHGMEVSGKIGKGRVAGPEQPPSQC
ncbi:hypothetical protein RHSIM_Rhsim03G0083400 [Rhododendron simsii]|uniref:CCHC-type domain-containing protein n=1 Tax=Rhododendron simsii TaxID=118357 RepID=A0A834H542_RHOSS|nr:hypothetical protein RHSIM_Rhsim03G0083400 [Rhododendron simsii]